MDKIQLLHDLYTELADIERRQQILTLPRSEQQELCQSWEEITKKIDDLEEELYGETHEDDTQWRDATAYLASDSRPPTPPAPEPRRLAPPPPPPVSRSVSSHGVPPPPSVAGAAWSPPPLEIPRIDRLISAAPPPPRARMYNDYDSEEEKYDADEIEEWNQIVDDREGCANCPGCQYCRDDVYDGNDEI